MDLDLDSLGSPALPGTSTDIDLDHIGRASQTARMGAMDFNLDLPAGSEDKTQSQMARVDSVDFDLKLDDFGGSATAAGKDSGLDFDINDISLESEGAAKSEPVLDLSTSAPPMPELDLSSISMDLGGANPAEEQAGAKIQTTYIKFDR